MKRYHKKVFYPNNAKAKLTYFTEALQGLTWQYSKHCIDNLKYRSYNIKDILLYIKDLKLDTKDIFEYYKNDMGIYKVCYRINFSKNIDLILVIDKNKTIITIYINGVNDNHFTLNKGLYVKN